MTGNSLVFVGVVALSILAGVVFEKPPPMTKKELFRALLSVADVGAPRPPASVVVGVNADVDVVVSAPELFEQLGVAHAEAPGDSESIASLGAFANRCARAGDGRPRTPGRPHALRRRAPARAHSRTALRRSSRRARRPSAS